MIRRVSDCIPEAELSKKIILEFDRTTNAFNYVFERYLNEGESIIIKMPSVSANKRGVNDIGWISDCEVYDDGTPKLKLYGTFSRNPRNPDALVQEIRVNDEINKVTSAIVVVNHGTRCKLEMRAIFC